MKKDLKAAVIQYTIPNTTDQGEKKVEKFVKEAASKGTDIVGLPEDCFAQYDDVRNGYDPMIFLSYIANKYAVSLFGATVASDKGKLYSRGFLFDNTGKLLSTHDKIVLAPPEEKIGLGSGNTLEVVSTEFGRMALLVCKDAFHRYAAWFFDELKKVDCDIVLIPSYSLNVSPTSIEFWVDSLKALSKWFDMYILGPSTVGKNATEFESFGHSLIICPTRGVLAEGSQDKEEILHVILSVGVLRSRKSVYAPQWQLDKVPDVKILIK